jgi:hypothetical protein
MAKRKPIDAKKAISSLLPPPGTDPTPAAPSSDPTTAYKITAKPEQLRAIVSNPPPRPSVQAFLDHWFAIRGGPAQFAADLCQEYDAASPGSLVRSQIIQLVVRSMKVADTKEGSMDELGLVTDADLDRLLETVGQKLVTEGAG